MWPIRLSAPFINSPRSNSRNLGYADIARLRIRIPFYVEYVFTYVGLLLDVKKKCEVPSVICFSPFVCHYFWMVWFCHGRGYIRGAVGRWLRKCYVAWGRFFCGCRMLCLVHEELIKIASKQTTWAWTDRRVELCRHLPAKIANFRYHPAVHEDLR